MQISVKINDDDTVERIMDFEKELYLSMRTPSKGVMVRAALTVLMSLDPEERMAHYIDALEPRGRPFGAFGAQKRSEAQMKENMRPESPQEVQPFETFAQMPKLPSKAPKGWKSGDPMPGEPGWGEWLRMNPQD